MKKYSTAEIRRVLSRKDYKIFERPRELNIVGIRNRELKLNLFNELIVVFYEKDGKEHSKYFKATTRPGLYWMKKLINPKGTGILVEGQYLDTYMLDIHNRGKSTEHLALCQRLKPVRVYRDANQDSKLDYNIIEENGQGFNIHRASKYKIVDYVDAYSAGCQVIQNSKEFEELILLSKIHSSLYGNKFSYTLINEFDFLLNASEDLKWKKV